MNFLLDWIEVVMGVAVAITIALLMLSHRFIGYAQMRKMSGSTFVIIEASPVHLDDLIYDMTRGGWAFVSSTATKGNTSLFHFQKANPVAKELSDLIFKEDGMPKTANRQRGADLLIKIADYGKL